jgi:serine-type D-Ala-D-Ala carboxypeptidase/endopeptidase (penicillin-binding protein 4)
MIFTRRCSRLSTRGLRAYFTGCAILGATLLLIPSVVCAQSELPHVQTPLSASAANKARSTQRPDVARFRTRVEATLSAPGPDKGLWGLLITDADSGEALYSQNADSLFTPASDTKLFTTALALATLGPNYQIRTTIETPGALDQNGVLRGDLVLVGRGDANLSNRKFPFDKKVEREGAPEKAISELADAVVVHGVKQIVGDVIADDSMFRSERFPDGWSVDDMLWGYGAAVSAIAVNDNTFTLDLLPGDRDGAPVSIAIDRQTDFYEIENSVRTIARGTEEKLAVAREPGSRKIRVSGTMPAGAAVRHLEIAIEEPAEYAAALLAHLLEERGVQISGSALARHASGAEPAPSQSEPATILAEHVSLPLSEDIRLTNKASINLHAELMLLLAAHEKAAATSREDAMNVAGVFFKTAGIAEKSVILEDGSGLSRQDLATPRAFVQLLGYAAKQPWGELYRSTLPVAGEDGTLMDRMKNTPAAGHVFAKTGTIEHVNALSGYATTERGAHLIFSILGNNNDMHAQAADAVIDSIVVAMVQELGPAPAAKLKTPAARPKK